MKNPRDAVREAAFAPGHGPAGGGQRQPRVRLGYSFAAFRPLPFAFPFA